jgi:hypothetical protein
MFDSFSFLLLRLNLFSHGCIIRRSFVYIEHYFQSFFRWGRPGYRHHAKGMGNGIKMGRIPELRQTRAGQFVGFKMVFLLTNGNL